MFPHYYFYYKLNPRKNKKKTYTDFVIFFSHTFLDIKWNTHNKAKTKSYDEF